MASSSKVSLVSGIRPTAEERVELDRGHQPHPEASRRKATRIALAESFTLIVRLAHIGGGVTTVSACARDMSAAGIGFYHAAYVHPGTECAFLMKTVEGRPLSVVGRIIRCRHVHGRLHIVGAEFNTPVELHQLVANAPAQVSDANDDAADAAAPDVRELHTKTATLAAEIGALAASQADAAVMLTKAEELIRLVAAAVEARAGQPQPEVVPPSESSGSPAPAASAPAAAPGEASAAPTAPAGAPTP